MLLGLFVLITHKIHSGLENNVFCRKYYHPLKDTKNTVEIYNKILCLPCTKDMTKRNIDFIINLF